MKKVFQRSIAEYNLETLIQFDCSQKNPSIFASFFSVANLKFSFWVFVGPFGKGLLVDAMIVLEKLKLEVFFGGGCLSLL